MTKMQKPLTDRLLLRQNRACAFYCYVHFKNKRLELVGRTLTVIQDNVSIR